MMPGLGFDFEGVCSGYIESHQDFDVSVWNLGAITDHQAYSVLF